MPPNAASIARRPRATGVQAARGRPGEVAAHTEPPAPIIDAGVLAPSAPHASPSARRRSRRRR
jgi:hypothetical protein